MSNATHFWELILGTVIGQGLAAWYYFRRKIVLRGFLAEPPATVDLFRRGLI